MPELEDYDLQWQNFRPKHYESKGKIEAKIEDGRNRNFRISKLNKIWTASCNFYSKLRVSFEPKTEQKLESNDTNWTARSRTWRNEERKKKQTTWIQLNQKDKKATIESGIPSYEIKEGKKAKWKSLLPNPPLPRSVFGPHWKALKMPPQLALGNYAINYNVHDG